jgi:heat shock protein HslJ
MTSSPAAARLVGDARAMRQPIRLVLLACSIGFVLAAAPKQKGGAESKTRPAAGLKGKPAPPARPPSPLERVRWRLESMRTESAEAAAPIEGSELTALFDSDRVTGSGGCNRFTAGYTLDGDHVTVSHAAATQMACPQPGIMEQEGAYLRALHHVARFRLQDGALTLEDTAGAPLLVYRPEPPQVLAGTSWQMTFYDDGEGGFVSGLRDVAVTATFDEDGTVDGSSGCSDYHGKYATEGDTLHIRSLIVGRKKGCPDDRRAQERAYLAALQSATRFLIDGDRLLLSRAGAARAVSYVAAPPTLPPSPSGPRAGP